MQCLIQLVKSLDKNCCLTVVDTFLYCSQGLDSSLFVTRRPKLTWLEQKPGMQIVEHVACIRQDAAHGQDGDGGYTNTEG